MNAHKYHIIEQPVGWMGLLGTDRGLRRLSLKTTPQEALDNLGPELEQAVHEPDGFDSELGCLERYFRGESGALDEIELDLEDATPFFKSAWQACRSIPPGETRSYGWLAAAAGRPQAARGGGSGHGQKPSGSGYPLSPGHRRQRRPTRIWRGRAESKGRLASHGAGRGPGVGLKASRPSTSAFPLDSELFAWGLRLYLGVT